MSDYQGAALMLPAMPRARHLLANKGYISRVAADCGELGSGVLLKGIVCNSR